MQQLDRESERKCQDSSQVEIKIGILENLWIHHGAYIQNQK